MYKIQYQQNRRTTYNENELIKCKGIYDYVFNAKLENKEKQHRIPGIETIEIDKNCETIYDVLLVKKIKKIIAGATIK